MAFCICRERSGSTALRTIELAEVRGLVGYALAVLRGDGLHATGL